MLFVFGQRWNSLGHCHPWSSAKWETLSSAKFPDAICGTRPGKRLHNELERSTMLFMGKSTISTGSFSIAMFVYQRVL